MIIKTTIGKAIEGVLLQQKEVIDNLYNTKITIDSKFADQIFDHIQNVKDLLQLQQEYITELEFKVKKKVVKKDHLFCESEFYDFEKFKLQFENTDYQYCDLGIYYEKIKNWSAAGGAKKIDWIATARNFMLSDKENNKLILKNGTKQINSATTDKIKSSFAKIDNMFAGK